MYHAFPCGTLALDFVGTLRARRNSEPTEKLSSPDLLDLWFTESGMLDHPAGADRDDLATAVELREAIYALVSARIHRAERMDEDIAVVNRHAQGTPVGLQLVNERVERAGSSAQGLATLARQAVEILGSDDAALLRECARPECTQVYLDHSRGHRREWCAMRTCGNRVKASQFRARQRMAATVEDAAR
jgi:predicted RNA-binding Zn ribbon-like protein